MRLGTKFSPFVPIALGVFSLVVPSVAAGAVASGSNAVVGATGVRAAAAPAAPRPRTLTSHCTVSGDICLAIIDRRGTVYLRLSMAARYFGRYRLCVRPPGSGSAGVLRCGSYPVLGSRLGSWGSSVNYSRNFPTVGPGTYRVTWKHKLKPLGPTLRFRLPLAG